MKKRTKFTTRDWVVIIVGCILSVTMGISSLLFAKEIFAFNSLIMNKVCEATMFGCSGLPIGIAVIIVYLKHMPSRKKRSKRNR